MMFPPPAPPLSVKPAHFPHDYLWRLSSSRPDGPPLAAGGVGPQLVAPDEAGGVGVEGREVEVAQGGQPVAGQVLHGQR